MCIIVDTNTLSAVFDEKADNHNEFKAVLEWVVNGNGKFIYGGSKYIKELSMTKYMAIFVQLRAANKAVYVDSKIVDKDMEKISQMVINSDFDDQHIVALLRKSECKLVCSLDSRAYPYFQHSLFFSKNKRPKIYSGSRNLDLLSSNNMVDLCVPCIKLNKKKRELLEASMKDIVAKKK